LVSPENGISAALSDMNILILALASWIASPPSLLHSEPQGVDERAEALERATARQKLIPDFSVVYHLRPELNGVAQPDLMRSQLTFSRRGAADDQDGLCFLDFAHQSPGVDWRDWPDRIRVFYRPDGICTEWPNSRLFYQVEPRAMPLQLVENMFLRITGFCPPGKGWGAWAYLGLDLDLVTILGKKEYVVAVSGELGTRHMTLTNGVHDSVVLAEDQDWRMVSRAHDDGRVGFRIDAWRSAGGESWPLKVVSSMVDHEGRNVQITMELVSVVTGTEVEVPRFELRPGYLRWDPAGGTHEQVMGGGIDMFEYQRRFVKTTPGLCSLGAARLVALSGVIAASLMILLRAPIARILAKARRRVGFRRAKTTTAG
jgi:hypothetical protein